MTIAVKPLQQALAQTLTVAAIDVGAKDNATKLARAMTAKTIAGILQSASTGDMSAATSEVNSLIGAISDPGLKSVAENLAAIGNSMLGIGAGAVRMTPGVDVVVAGYLSLTAAGMLAGAQPYIDAYSQSAAAPAGK